ncbi:uracil-DNA glycosylase [Treponema medium]|uniref:Type-4 uracil-DNA glycosylase n=3 Tax=Treponema medium TaxID=58231 RepID=A0AA87NL97_TREMD|nr:uracil-DNA glycosylase [Treponema medium]EPF28310.1 uracil-DNA glycosylase, family 4 [Treponema medium ATCC 700293]QSH97627.1 uracil-DNA glycosylase [Treponema medium]
MVSMETEACEILYRFFRTASEYIEGYRSDAPYPESFAFVGDSTAAAVTTSAAATGSAVNDDFAASTASAAAYPAGTGNEQSGIGKAAFTGLVGNSGFAADGSLAAPIAGSASGGMYTEAVGGSGGALFRSMQEIYAAVAQCSACVLGQTRTHPVAGEGPEELSRLTNSVEVMVIGEGPGADEDRQGRPFVGRAGQLLDKMLEAIQLSRKTNCYITNVVKCRPPQNRDPAPEERSCCAAFLDAQIRLLRPKMILVMGRIAAQHLLQTSDGIGKLRGRFFDYQGIPLMPTYHPSALLRDESLKRPAWEDLKRFRARLHELQAQG